jgi:ATP-dependent Clp protease ATP-binding subunit ClpC
MNQVLSDETTAVLAAARLEALELGHGYVGTLHILLALLDQAAGESRRLLNKFGATEPRVRRHVSKRIRRGAGRALPATLPYNARARTALEMAATHARRHGELAVAPEHLLAGLVQDDDFLSARVLGGYGMTAVTLASA